MYERERFAGCLIAPRHRSLIWPAASRARVHNARGTCYPSLFARRGRRRRGGGAAAAAILKGDSSWEIKARAPKWNASAARFPGWRGPLSLPRPGKGRPLGIFLRLTREPAFDTCATCRRSSYLLRAPAPSFNLSVPFRPLAFRSGGGRTDGVTAADARYELSRPVKARVRWRAERSGNHGFPAAPPIISLLRSGVRRLPVKRGTSRNRVAERLFLSDR